MDYSITVRTPFGRFSGRMELSIEGDSASGILSFMSFSSSFIGDASGNSFSFSGTFDTPIGALEYKASASIESDGVHGTADTRLGELEFFPER